MNPICDGCVNQKSDGKGGVNCGKAQYHNSGDGYGEFKHGSNCVYDVDLQILFKARTGEETEVRNLSSMVSRQRDKIQQLEYEKGQLEQSLISINREGK
jgi:hypothetical protein